MGTFIRMVFMGLLVAFIFLCILSIHLFCGWWIGTSAITTGDYVPFGIFFAHFFKVFSVPVAIIGFALGFITGFFGD
jgi:hypothetical protein